MSHLGDLGSDLAIASLTLARRFAAGATMWCTSPAWPHHAHHVAVEFVHPVIVGKRALPAVAVTDADPIPALRTLARSGDILLAVANADDRAVAGAMQRCRAWGLASLWIGSGQRPDAGSADHVLWLDGLDRDGVEPHGLAASTGRFVLLYHLLWELTHVCFEHPGLVRPEPLDDGCEDGVCVTCGDEGRLGEVTVTAASEVRVRTATGSEAVDTSLVGPLALGDLVLVHAGMAIGVVDGHGPDSGPSERSPDSGPSERNPDSGPSERNPEPAP